MVNGVVVSGVDYGQRCSGQWCDRLMVMVSGQR